MRRSAVVIPVLAVLVGALLLLLRKPAPPALPPAIPRIEEPKVDAHGHPVPAARSPRPEDKLPEGTAGFRFRVHHRGQPLAEAEIFVTRVLTDRPYTLKTNADGTRLLVGLPPAEYSLTAKHLPKHRESSLHFQVEAGRIYEVDFNLERGCRIHGTVLNSSGTPLKDAKVVLHVAGTAALSPFRTTTDAQGRFELEPVEPGFYNVSVRHERHKGRGDQTASVPRPGDAFEVNVVLETGAQLGGRVVDDEGNPVEGASITVANAKTGATTKSDKDGRFMVYGQEAVPTNLSAQKAGLGMVYLRNAPPHSTDLVLRMPTPGTVHGRVVADPLPESFGVALYGYDAALKQKAPLYSRFFTAPAEGRFILPDVAPGTYTVEIILDGWELSSVPEFTVQAKGVVENLDLRLRPKK